MEKSQRLINYLLVTEDGFRTASDDTFNSDGKYFPKFKKKGVITVENEDEYHQINPIFCNVPGCERLFQSIFAYQSHYNSLHRYICSQCKKNLPTPHLLDIHLSENHDSYFSVLSKSKPMYSCFIEECHHKSQTAEERKDHCISAHKFPLDFRFENLCLVGKKDLPKADAMADLPLDGKKMNSNFSFGHAKCKTFDKKSYSRVLTKSDVEYKNVLEDSKTVADLLSSLQE